MNKYHQKTANTRNETSSGFSGREVKEAKAFADSYMQSRGMKRSSKGWPAAEAATQPKQPKKPVPVTTNPKVEEKKRAMKAAKEKHL